jgi:hypothetical protein
MRYDARARRGDEARVDDLARHGDIARSPLHRVETLEETRYGACGAVEREKVDGTGPDQGQRMQGGTCHQTGEHNSRQC